MARHILYVARIDGCGVDLNLSAVVLIDLYLLSRERYCRERIRRPVRIERAREQFGA